MFNIKPLIIPANRKFSSQCQGNKVHLLDLDQYYTPLETAEHCMNVIASLDLQISELFEPSAGTGAFIEAAHKVYPTVPVVGVDLEPKYEGIQCANFLSVKLPYKKGRMFFGNPPFGPRLALAQKFYKKCINCGDFIAWILPISQYQSNAMYEFDLVYSENLGTILFSDIKPVKCCFNVYCRPSSGNLNKHTKFDIHGVKFKRSDNKGYDSFDYDFRLCCWGSHTGCILEEHEKDYAATYKIKVIPELRDKVVEIIRNTDWSKVRSNVSCRNLTKSEIVKVLNDNGVK